MSCNKNKTQSVCEKEIEFFSKKGVCNERKLVYALSHHHPGFPKSKLHPHFSRINFPPQANNKAALLRETESRILNLGPKFVPPAPEQVLERLPNEIRQMKEKVSTAWRRVTKTIGRQPPIVDKFCKRIEDEIRKTVATEAPSDPALKPAIAFFHCLHRYRFSITWTSGKTIEYLDVKVTIETPHFRTTVFRKLAAQPYVLPFNSAHPPHITRNIPYAAALRA
ncbi:unnamed protein product, partial [Rotaria magnacalcarata]